MNFLLGAGAFPAWHGVHRRFLSRTRFVTGRPRLRHDRTPPSAAIIANNLFPVGRRRAGSLGLFAALAAVMYVTRNVDRFRIGQPLEGERPAA